MRQFCAAALAALFLFIGLVSHASAQDITLRSRDGGVELTGTLLGFDGEFYRLQTQYGELTVDSSGVLCEGVGCPSLTDFVAELTVSGSETMGAVLMPALIEAFALRGGLTTSRETTGPDTFTYHLKEGGTGKTVGRFFFHLTNTDTGFADLLSDNADIVMALREIRRAEITRAHEAGLGDLQKHNRSRVLALDAMVPIVAPGNPVDAISPTDLSRILAGTLTNWATLGGPDAPISIHLRNPGSGLAQGVEDRLVKPARVTLTDGIIRHDSNTALAEAIARDPFGIGLASYSEIGNTKPLDLTGPCGFRLNAARRTIKTEDFPLTAPMFLYLPARRLPALAREFLAYTGSTSAQIVIRRAGFVDQAPEEVPIDLQGDRFRNAIAVADGTSGLSELQRMAKTLSGKRRLTLSFRFEPGASRLDAQSRSNVQHLARALEAGTYDGRHMLFVGFSDGQGPAEGNLRIAQKRAEAVRLAVVEAAETADLSRVVMASDAFGEAMPMACDDSTWGRQANRRVEVWLE
ncbi:substrate-binding domain-containing protein [Tropicibacter sp. S64]|uniref:substrate-binding domain-containing protein n=1 Tax=Tropicibacter sp. S64 TaxID=3415122 RepID=UPI003C7D36F2